ncbi:MAG TPA: DUF364 domain-containing protein [Burkholderiaceae bacterium]|nr:DUF364 domain-containing protein [Burkholderiaceae bacterium]
MSVAAELLALFDRAAPCLGRLRVRRLHLPPPNAADSLSGEFCALELDNGAIGLSYVLLDGMLARLMTSSEAGALEGADAWSVARGYADTAAIRRTLGFAAVNALSRSLFDRARFAPSASADSIGLLQPQPSDHIGMIGYFGRLIPRVIGTGARLTIVELRADLAGAREDYRVTLDPGELATCNKILSTSTLLLNDTLDRMLAACTAARIFAMVGPGAGCLPDPLFARGVSLLGGTWIDDPRSFCRALVAGESWQRHAHKCALRREDYPGFEELLARANADTSAAKRS